MTELRKSIVDRIYREVGSTYFGTDNYKVTFPESGSPLVNIVFIAEPSYIFTIDDDYSKDGRVSTNESPGDFKNSNEYDDLSIQSAIGRIDSWAKRVRQELSSNGIKEIIPDDVFEKIDEYVASLKSPKENFTQTEIEELKKNLSELQIKFEDLLEKSVITETDLKALKNQINGAEKDLPVFSKEIWYKISMRKVVGTTKSILTSKEGRYVALGLVKKLICSE